MILQQSFELLFYYCLRQGKDEPLVHPCKSCCPCALVNALGRAKAFREWGNTGPAQDVSDKAWKGAWQLQKWGGRMQAALACLRPAGRIQLQPRWCGASSSCLLQRDADNRQDSHRLDKVFCFEPIREGFPFGLSQVCARSQHSVADTALWISISGSAETKNLSPLRKR